MNNILDYLEASCARTPEKIALEDASNQVTYEQLRMQAQKIGSRIAQEGFRNRPVAVVIRRNVESIIMFMGIVYSGNFYVPLDAQMPQGRLEKMLNVLQPGAIVGMQEDLVQFAHWNTVPYEELIQSSVNETLLSRIRKEHLDQDPLYAIFTSGSTGVPKSVLISHRGVIDLTDRFAEVFPFSSEDRFGNQAPFDFDVSVKDIYQSLKQGGTLVVIPKEFFSMPAKLISYMNERQITAVIWAVSALQIVARLKALRKEVPEYLRIIMFSGEVMPVKVLNYWRENLSDALYVNLYGPTEITCNCTYYKVDRPFANEESLPIGIPFPNTRIYLLNEKNEACADGEVGEICVSGAGVALGYYAETEKTAAVFIQNPLNPSYREIIYKTGDLGRWDDDGQLIFLGRRDYQIKHMGHRIELGEIETAVNALSFIDAGCCIYDESKEKIVLFYLAQESCDKEILLGLKDKLPKYIWPNKLIHQKELPLNAHGKIDRVYLKRRYLDGTDF